MRIPFSVRRTRRFIPAAGMAAAIVAVVLLVSGCPLFPPDLGLSYSTNYSGDSFEDTAEITLIPVSSRSNVYYTLDGSRPGQEKTLYTDPITISQTTNLRARAFYGDEGGEELDLVFLKSTVASEELTGLSGEDAYLLLVNPERDTIHKGFSLNNSTAPAPTAARSASSAAPLSQSLQPPQTDDPYRRIQESNRELMQAASSSPARSISPGEPLASTDSSWDVGTERPIYIDRDGTTVDTTLRLKRKKTFGSEPDVTLYIWVEDASWEGGTKEHKVTPEMVTAMADRFLHESDDAIYEWVIDIAGEPWGSHSYTDIVSPEERDHIHIVIKDIADGYSGYFWGIHNFITTESDTSNEGLYFFMDSQDYARPEGDTWEATDFFPEMMYSTLAHEFQHMIQFYQKGIVHNVGADTWLNELASMAVEDLLADKIGVAGPRGIPLDNGSFVYGPAQKSSDNQGRVIWFNTSPNYNLTAWTDNYSFEYALSYMFGAYLMRAYNGPGIIRDIVQSQYGSIDAITTAVANAGGGDLDFGDILLNFGEAALRSGDATDAAGKVVRMNNGSIGFTYNSDLDNQFRLGSLDLHSFHSLVETTSSWSLADNYGPVAVPVGDVTVSYEFPPTSTHYILLGENLSGDHSFDFVVPDGMEYRVIAADRDTQ